MGLVGMAWNSASQRGGRVLKREDDTQGIWTILVPPGAGPLT